MTEEKTTPQQFVYYYDTIPANGNAVVVIKIPRYLTIVYFSFQTSGALKIIPQKNELLQRLENSSDLIVDGNLELKGFRYKYRSELEFRIENTEGVENQFVFIIGVRRD